MAELRRRLSGLALPTYVLDLPGAHGKVPLESYAQVGGDGSTEVRDAHDRVHYYEDCCAAPDVP
jgi:lysine 2,3-aminomutase